MLAVSGTVVNASVTLTRRVAATHESESDCAWVRFSDLLMCADLRSTNRPTITVLVGRTMRPPCTAEHRWCR